MVNYSWWFPVLHVKENGNSPLKSRCSFSFCLKNIWWTEWQTSMQLNQSAVALKLLFEKLRWGMSSPWSRYSYSYIILWLNVRLTFIVFCYVSHCQKVVYHLFLMFIFWIEAYLSLAVESKLLFNQTDNELHPSSPLILHIAEILELWFQLKSF